MDTIKLQHVIGTILVVLAIAWLSAALSTHLPDPLPGMEDLSR